MSFYGRKVGLSCTRHFKCYAVCDITEAKIELMLINLIRFL